MTGATPNRMGRPRSEDALSEDDVLVAALRAFAAHGYQGMSVRDLNTELGVSHNLIHRRFGSKAELWKRTLDRWFTEFTEQLEPVLASIRPGEPIETFRAYIIAFIETSAARPELLRMAIVEAAIESERIEYAFQNHIRPFGRRINEVVRSLEGSERWTALPASTTFFLLVHGAIAAPAHRPLALRLEGGDPNDPVALRLHAEIVADLLLGVDPLVRLKKTKRSPKSRRRAP